MTPPYLNNKILIFQKKKRGGERRNPIHSTQNHIPSLDNLPPPSVPLSIPIGYFAEFKNPAEALIYQKELPHKPTQQGK